jgi:hypothetical protein
LCTPVRNLPRDFGPCLPFRHGEQTLGAFTLAAYHGISFPVSEILPGGKLPPVWL